MILSLAFDSFGCVYIFSHIAVGLMRSNNRHYLLVGGKTVFSLYLVPDGYEKLDDDNGYTVIAKEGTGAVDARDEDLPDLPL